MWHQPNLAHHGSVLLAVSVLKHEPGFGHARQACTFEPAIRTGRRACHVSFWASVGRSSTGGGSASCLRAPSGPRSQQQGELPAPLTPAAHPAAPHSCGGNRKAGPQGTQHATCRALRDYVQVINQRSCRSQPSIPSWAGFSIACNEGRPRHCSMLRRKPGSAAKQPCLCSKLQRRKSKVPNPSGL